MPVEPIKPIRSRTDLDRALARMEELWGAAPGTPEADELDVLSDLVETYEARYRIPPGDPVELVRFKMKELGLSQNALARRLGWSSGRVSELLSGKRSLTLAMVRALATALDLPPGALVGEERGGAPAPMHLSTASSAKLAWVAEALAVDGETLLERLVGSLILPTTALGDVVVPGTPARETPDTVVFGTTCGVQA